MPPYTELAFPTTREDALASARQFAPQMGGDYANNRNFVVPGHRFVSRLAPAIRIRLLSESELIGIALNEFKDLAHCEKFVQEVYWRLYWRSWLELRPSVWTHYLHGLAEVKQNSTPEQQARVLQVESGESGVAPMDEFARELVATGYLHNHARMWFAAYWIHSERLPWQLGADFFDRHLICACPASNTLSWRWVAGLQTQGKPYLARRSNLEKFCDASYLGDEHGMERLEHPVAAPLLADTIPPPQQPECNLGFEAPNSKVGLWIHQDDFAPETSVLGSAAITAVCTSVLAAPHASKRSNGKRRAYRLKAAEDAAKRAQTHWACSSHALSAENEASFGQHMAAWAQQHELSTIVAIKPFVGPTNDALPAVRDRLATAGIDLKLVRRSEDANVLPWATRGYFHFWQMSKKHGIGTA